MNSLPLWVADCHFKTVFFNRWMRERFGVSVDQVSAGLSLADLTQSGAIDADRSRVGLQAANWKLQHADGRHQWTVSYYRALHFGGVHYGYVGATVPYDYCSENICPSPLKPAPANRAPRVSIDLGGVAVDLVSGYIRSLGPLVDIRNSEDCVNLDSFRQSVTDLQLLCHPTNIFRPTPEFFTSLDAYRDFNCRLVSELHAIEAIQVCYFPFLLPDGTVVAASPMEFRFWCEKYGLAYGEVDCGPQQPVEKMLSRNVDVHLEDNPEQWVEALFAGIPCFLMDRPWNRSIRSPFRVYSVEAMLTACGVEIHRTFSDYDPSIMSRSVAMLSSVAVAGCALLDALLDGLTV